MLKNFRVLNCSLLFWYFSLLEWDRHRQNLTLLLLGWFERNVIIENFAMFEGPSEPSHLSKRTIRFRRRPSHFSMIIVLQHSNRTSESFLNNTYRTTVLIKNFIIQDPFAFHIIDITNYWQVAGRIRLRYQ